MKHTASSVEISKKPFLQKQLTWLAMASTLIALAITTLGTLWLEVSEFRHRWSEK